MKAMKESIFVYGEEKKNSKGLTVTLICFILFVAVFQLWQGTAALIKLYNGTVEMSPDVTENESVCLTLRSVYAPFGYESNSISIVGYYALCADDCGDCYVLYFNDYTQEKYGLDFSEQNPLNFEGLQISGSTLSLSSSYSQEAEKAFENVSCKGELVSDVYVSIDNHTPLITALSNIGLGLLFLGLVILLFIWKLKSFLKRKA